ncbi:MAG: hypothetical protein WBG86_01285, partial [Polyangiales bacterium]
QDLDAARVVFESGVPVVYIPGFFVGEKLRVSRPEMVEYIEGRGEVGDFLFELYEGHPLFGSHYARSKVLWDMVTIGYLVDPSWFHENEVAAMTLDDEQRWVPGMGAPVVEPIDVERDRIFEDFYDKMAAQDEGAGGTGGMGGPACEFTMCPMRCVDVDTDDQNCGTCGTICEAPDVCAGGVCTPG